MKKIITATVVLFIITIVVVLEVKFPQKTSAPTPTGRLVSVTNDLGAIHTEIKTARQESSVQNSNICARLSVLEARTSGLENNQSAIVEALKDMDKRTEIIAEVLRSEVNHRVSATTAPLSTPTAVLPPAVQAPPAPQPTSAISRGSTTKTDWGPQANTSPWIPQPLPEVRQAPVVKYVYPRYYSSYYGGYGYPRYYGSYYGDYGYEGRSSLVIGLGFGVGNHHRGGSYYTHYSGRSSHCSSQRRHH